jgi:maltose alpha-D-glucosyltransferase/alpha-amylase
VRYSIQFRLMTKRSIRAFTTILLYAACLAAFYSCKDKPPAETTSEKTPAPDSIENLWYKNSVIYTLDIEVFQDSDGDGVGDIKGLISRLDYIDSLGADAIWLSPFQPTPNRDDGYDISDYYQIDKRLGTLNDFKALIAEARKRDLRLIMDLVINHTSNEHPWFRQARSGSTSPYRSWYVWSPTRPENYNVGMVFPGVQDEIWSYDSVAKEYYYHRFYDFQPDLNMQEPAVQAEVKKIIDYWLAAGLDGFRIDAVPFAVEVPAKEGDDFTHQYNLISDFHQTLEKTNPDAVMLGEANVSPEENKNYFGENGDGLQMMFNFFVNQYVFYALASGEVKPLEKALAQTHDIPTTAQWGQFLRNHDEVDLGRLSDRERQQVYDSFGPAKNMQLYDRGIRRRLAPMLHNDRNFLELAYSLLFALPSTPVIRYGDEIGMGDDLTLKERLAVRTPMQWSAKTNGGFSTASKTVLPVITQGPYGYKTINIQTAMADPHSLLHWTRQMINLRKACPEIAYGTWKVSIPADNVLLLHYEWKGTHVVTAHNFSREDREFNVTINQAGVLQNLLTRQNLSPENGRYTIRLKSLGYSWMRGIPSSNQTAGKVITSP